MAGGAELLVWPSTATILWWSRPGPQLQAGPWPGPQTRELQQLWWTLYKVQKMTRFCSAQPLCWPFTQGQDGYQFLAVGFPVFSKCFSRMFSVTCSATTEKAAYGFGWWVSEAVAIYWVYCVLEVALQLAYYSPIKIIALSVLHNAFARFLFLSVLLRWVWWFFFFF